MESSWITRFCVLCAIATFSAASSIPGLRSCKLKNRQIDNDIDSRHAFQYVPVFDKCIALIYGEKSWSAAEEYCKGSGGHLVKIDNKYEDRALSALADLTQEDIWIGLREDKTEKGSYFWISDQSVFLPQYSSKFQWPGHTVGETCFVFSIKQDAWLPRSCNSTQTYFFCERQSDYVQLRTPKTCYRMFKGASLARYIKEFDMCLIFNDAANYSNAGAERACRDDWDAELLKFHTREQEQSLTGKHFGRSRYYYIGLHKLTNSSIFTWSYRNGSEIALPENRSHSAIYPNIIEGEVCGAKDMMEPRIVLYDCSEVLPYICQRKHPGLPLFGGEGGCDLYNGLADKDPRFAYYYNHVLDRCIVYVEHQKTFEDAEDFCRGLGGGHLVKVNNKMENEYLIGYDKRPTYFWLGLYRNPLDPHDTEDFLWLSDGKPFKLSEKFVDVKESAYGNCFIADSRFDEWIMTGCDDFSSFFCERETVYPVPRARSGNELGASVRQQEQQQWKAYSYVQFVLFGGAGVICVAVLVMNVIPSYSLCTEDHHDEEPSDSSQDTFTKAPETDPAI